MIVIPCRNTVFFDVDDTLVAWNATPEQLQEHGVEFECPGSMHDIDNDGNPVYCPPWKALLLPHRKHIEQLKKHKMRGHTIVVWSAGGFDWAAAVVKTLGLESYVDLVISKPVWFYDDLTPDEFMGKRYYMDDKD